VFIYKNEQFNKTGSGQRWERWRETACSAEVAGDEDYFAIAFARIENRECVSLPDQKGAGGMHSQTRAGQPDLSAVYSSCHLS
jgi:hypothetical protein